jgi:hypothetical protein
VRRAPRLHPLGDGPDRRHRAPRLVLEALTAAFGTGPDSVLMLVANMPALEVGVRWHYLSLVIQGPEGAAQGRVTSRAASHHLWPLASLDYAAIRFSLHVTD